ncbi:ferredoxin [Candidatus Woesearchaeota archaeon]|nr:ferredoxin [Candidatus Woesearchaeota archaeon]
MTKYMLRHDRPNCIGCAACVAIAPDYWEMASDDKSSIKGGKRMPDGTEERVIEEKDFAANKDAAQSCPVNVISVWDENKTKKIV